MGDVRFEPALRRVRALRSKGGSLRDVAPDQLLHSLAALAARADAMLANVIATELLNRTKRALTILDAVRDGVASLNAEGCVVYANRAAGRLLLVPPKDLIGRAFHDVAHAAHAGEAAPPDDCPLVRALQAGDAADTDTFDEDAFHRADGSTFLVGFSVSPVVQDGIPTGSVVVFRDITQQKNHADRLALAAAAMDSVDDPIFLLARDGRFLHANRAATDYLGYSREELLDMTVFEIDTDMSPTTWDEHWQNVAQQQPARLVTHHRTRDGTRLAIELVVWPVEGEYKEYHAAVVRRWQPL